MARILITGGAGFVGSALAAHLRGRSASDSITVLDNLRRRGSALNVDRLGAMGVRFVHGDVRNSADLESLEGTYDVLVEASAEPSALAGFSESPRYVLETNLVGALNCLEFARKCCGGLVFLSSSRVYSIVPLRAIPLVEQTTRLEVAHGVRTLEGLSEAGVSERFPCDSQRSYYGASKLAAEMLCQEYASDGGLPVVINRCGVIAGPGQFGKTDQGVFTLWVARHWFGRRLRYTGFGGKGLQVRDLLHVEDLCELVVCEMERIADLSGKTFNVGGGRAGSVSLMEFTSLCRDVVGREVPIEEEAETGPVDIPWYITDHSRVTADLSWKPRRRPKAIVEDIAKWLQDNEESIARLVV